MFCGPPRRIPGSRKIVRGLAVRSEVAIATPMAAAGHPRNPLHRTVSPAEFQLSISSSLCAPGRYRRRPDNMPAVEDRRVKMGRFTEASVNPWHIGIQNHIYAYQRPTRDAMSCDNDNQPRCSCLAMLSKGQDNQRRNERQPDIALRWLHDSSRGWARDQAWGARTGGDIRRSQIVAKR